MAGPCGVTINISTHQISARVSKAWREATPLLTQQILDDCNKYCKEDTGALIASSYMQSDLDKGIIRWRTPYARRQYWIKTAHTDKNPQARWKWAEYAKQRHLKQWKRIAEAELKAKLKET